MACEIYKNGRSFVELVLAKRRKPTLGGDASNLRLVGGAAICHDISDQQMHFNQVPIQHQSATCHDLPVDSPFMNNMDEISYWIHTKRAPCLMNYDNLVKKNDEAKCSKPKPKSVTPEEPSPKKKKKRKLSLLDDDSVSTEKKNVYFEVTQKHNGPAISNCKSDTLGSDIDFNIKNSSVQDKTRRPKLQKNSRTTLHKKNKVVTSTPKVTHLRRSLRQAQQSLNNNSQLNSSFELFINGNNNLKNNLSPEEQPSNKLKKTSEQLAGGDQTIDNKKNNVLNNKPKKSAVLNGQFEDLSDVSGFTANYIRSTKVQSNKTPKKLRCKPNRNLIKESKQTPQKNGSMLVCVNKAVNTGLQTKVFNCSTDSSQHIINLVTKNKTDKATKVSNKSTSVLKFMDTRTKSKSVSNKIDNGQPCKNNLNISFQSKSSTSRYNTRHKNHSADVTADNKEIVNQPLKNADDKRTKQNKNLNKFNNSDRKENPEDKVVSRTRSGRNIGLTLCQQDNSVLVLSNSSDQVSSMVSVNVASPVLAEQRDKLRKRKRTSAQHMSKRLINKSERPVQRDSLRDKSGFAACFSDSDDDSEPLKQRKFFRA